MLASVIVNGARLTLIDAAKATWSDSELLGYLNEAMKTVVFYKPDANPARGFQQLVAGITQTIPADGAAILDLFQNQASERAITLVDKELLDHANRFWPRSTPSVDVFNWCADPRDPKRFSVTPPNDGTGSVEMSYGQIPADVELDDDIPLTDTYQYVLECFVIGRAYAKNSKRQDLVKAGNYMNEFKQGLGIKSTAQIAVAPKVSQSEGK